MSLLKAVHVLTTDGLVALGSKAQWKLRKTARMALSRGAVRSDYGVLMTPNWGDATFEYCVLAEYGNVLSDLITAKAESFAFVDIGANQGLYSLVAAKNPRCVRALAYEPVARTFALLVQNIRLNGSDATVLPFNFGISTNEAEIAIFQNRQHSGKASLHRRDDNDQVEETISIKTARSIDQDLPAGLPLFIKIDVEGHEEAVLQSLAAAPFAARVTEVFYEVDEDWLDPASLETILRGIGFRQFEKHGSGRHYDVLATR